MRNNSRKNLKNLRIASGSSCSLIPLTLLGRLPNWYASPKQLLLSFSLLLLLFSLASCKTDYQNLPAFSEQKQLQVVILTPAGSNHPQEYDREKKSFVNAKDAGQPEQINFLPYPGNFGFIPSTSFKNENTAEGKPLPVLVLAESVPTGTVKEVIPIGSLSLDVDGEASFVVIAVPARPSEQVLEATDYTEFTTKYPAAKEIIQKWLIYHNPNRPTRLMGWQDEKFTENLIRRWLQ